MSRATPNRQVDEHTIARIAERVVDALREDLESLTAEVRSPATTSAEAMTVAQVARRLGVTRSTVYAHWREWGGYKLGSGEKAPIRFDGAALPDGRPARVTPVPEVPVPARRRRRRRDLLADAPRFAEPLDGTP